MIDTIKAYLKHNNASLIVLFIAFWTPILLFLKIAGEVLEKEPIPLDTAILNWIHGHANSFLDSFFLIATNVGGVIGIVVITVLFVAFLLSRKQRRNALLLIGGVGGAATANLILKSIFQRDRPSIFDSSIVETSFSFPSGHAMASSALALCIILVFWQTKWRWLAVSISVLGMLAIGISRLYFGVHYPTDVVAGWCVSAAWVVSVYYMIKKLRLRLNP